ncbi:flagellar biosynthesis anti-sigma factor FlgM [Caballeronia jiangsuensis]|nr:flagellar biosynthesis anti-sigma factor FlgM [Caballeronia jiangsuensis]
MDIDTDKVAAIKDALRDGSYSIDWGSIADGMLGMARELLGKNPQGLLGWFRSVVSTDLRQQHGKGQQGPPTAIPRQATRHSCITERRPVKRHCSRRRRRSFRKPSIDLSEPVHQCVKRRT